MNNYHSTERLFLSWVTKYPKTWLWLSEEKKAFIEEFDKFIYYWLLRMLDLGGNMNRVMSSSEMLQASSDGLYNTLLSIISPIFGGVEYLKRMRKEYLIRKELRALHQKKQEFILALIGVVPQEDSYEQYDELHKKLKEIQESPRFRKNFEKLNKIFDSLNERDQMNILLETAKRTHQIFSEMRSQISTKLIEASDIEDVIILGQALRCGEMLVGDVIESVNKKPPNLKHTRFCMNFLLVFLIKFLAIIIGKMNPQDLYRDIALCLYFCRVDTRGLGDDSAFAILGEK